MASFEQLIGRYSEDLEFHHGGCLRITEMIGTEPGAAFRAPFPLANGNTWSIGWRQVLIPDETMKRASTWT